MPRVSAKRPAPRTGLAAALIAGCAISGPAECDLEPGITPCGIVCADPGVLGGDSEISLVPSVDAFFASVADVRRAALAISGSMRAELEGIATSLAVEDVGELALDELASVVHARLRAKLDASTVDGLTIRSEPPRCVADLDVASRIAGECDLDAPPTIAASCGGVCEVSAGAAASCAAMDVLQCDGPAPDFACDGICIGSCELAVPGACEGACVGACAGTCRVCAGGECETASDAVTNCVDTCDGECLGECKLDGGGSCSGRCEGSCRYDPGTTMCAAGVTSRCDVSAVEAATCEGKCEGSITSPGVNAECQAMVEARSTIDLDCAPPRLTLAVQLDEAIAADADERAAFRSWLAGFELRYAALLAAQAKLVRLANVIVTVDAAAEGPIAASFDRRLDDENNLRTAIGLACAIEALEDARTVLADAQAELTASAEAFDTVREAISTS